MKKKTYTPREANRILPRVRRLVGQIVELVALLPDLQDQSRIAEYEFHRPRASEDDAIRVEETLSAVRSAEADLAEAVQELDDLGIRLKDARIGLVDFLAYREEELVELCWKLGEDEVRHWHRLGEGYPGRKPL